MTENTGIEPEDNLDDLKEYTIQSPITVGKYLQTIVNEENEVYLFVNGVDSPFVTEVLGLNLGEGHIFLGRPYDKLIQTVIGPQAEYAVVAFPEHIKIQFNGKGIEMVSYDGAQALQLPMPHEMLRLQRRNYFRVVADQDMMAHIHIDHAPHVGDYELTDLSQGGCGISVALNSHEFTVGQFLNDVKLMLPDEKFPVLVRLQVRNIKPNPEDTNSLILGCEMKLLNQRQESRLQRFFVGQRTSSARTSKCH